jgi:N-acetylmuramoyl-L-alanine amidase
MPMLRRKFISSLISSFFTLLSIPTKFFARQHASSTGNNEIHLVSASLRIDVKIPSRIKWGYEFISLDDFAQALHLGIYTNDQKRKSVLYIERDRLTFSADNTFIKLNDRILQQPLECFWQNEEVWVPIKYFIKILNQYTALRLIYNPDEKQILIKSADVNISSVRLDPKENGTMIKVGATQQFTEKDIVLDIRNGWFHIDIYGGKIDIKSISAIHGSGIIGQVKGFQLGETASLSFKLNKDIISEELGFYADSNDFYVNLRTGGDLTLDNNQKNKEELEVQKKKWMIDTIVLDAGHGGMDPGALGYSKIREKNIALAITLSLGKILQRNMPDIKVVYTRKKDIFIPLWKRTKIANDVGAKLFISIHCNSNKSRRANGFETYILSPDKDERAKDVVLKENSVIEFEASQDRKKYEALDVNFILATLLQSANIRNSQYLASLIQNSLGSKMKKLGMSSRGVKQGPFWVLVGATMPNVLVEVGYISNQHEENLLKKQTTQQKIAEGIFFGIKKYKEDIENAS